jgi:hypothetical protein
VTVVACNLDAICTVIILSALFTSALGVDEMPSSLRDTPPDTRTPGYSPRCQMCNRFAGGPRGRSVRGAGDKQLVPAWKQMMWESAIV